MAKQKGMYYVGRKGNVLYYELNGGYYQRSAPVSVKQTAATKVRISNFAIAVGASRVLRNQLLPILPFPKDKKMQNSFGGAIMKWLKLEPLQQLQPADNLSFIQGFRFNSKSNMAERWKVKLTVTKVGEGLLQFHIPAFIPSEKITEPAWTRTIECTIAAASCNLKNKLANGNCVHAFAIPYNNVVLPQQTINLPVAMPGGSLVVTTVSLTYIVSKKGSQVPTDNIAFMPSDIIAAMYV
jgi:hypothetical protein